MDIRGRTATVVKCNQGKGFRALPHRAGVLFPITSSRDVAAAVLRRDAEPRITELHDWN